MADQFDLQSNVRAAWEKLYLAAIAQRGRTNVAKRAWAKNLREASLDYAEKVRSYSDEDYSEEVS